MKLTSSITSNGVKLIEIYNKITSGSLIPGPDFQRKLVWKKQHKYAFIDTILLNFPFPEVYIASVEVDVDSLQSKEVVVDGQQRLTTIVDYIKGVNDFKNQKTVTPFDELNLENKREFLNYIITVKDLKDIGEKRITEVFKRINSTNYSLNSNEVLNAEYGGGEFAIFCKALIDSSEDLSKHVTDVSISTEDRELFLKFFNENEIFSDNDVKRMFDSQFIMLIAATILEGAYFGRSTKINNYLEKYNSSFENYKSVLSAFKNSIEIINALNFSQGSYWFNKPNLFTLIFELKSVKIEELDLEILETKLLELEQKMDLYFNAENDSDIGLLSEDERKYFELARQGSHEFASRELRGRVVSTLINDSKKIIPPLSAGLSILDRNLKLLNDKGVAYSTLIPTQTGLKKGIMDAVAGVRVLLKEKGIHDYETQEWGPLNKVVLEGKFIQDGGDDDTKISFYRSNGRGDYRIWFKDLANFVNADEELALIIKDGVVNVLNITRYEYKEM